MRWNAGNQLHEAGVALLLFVLRDMREELLWVGSRTTRGYGHLKEASISKARLSLVDQQDGVARRCFHDLETPGLSAIVARLPGCEKAWQRLMQEVA